MQRLNARLKRNHHGKKRWDLFFIVLPLMLFVFFLNYVPLAGWYLAFIDYKVGKPILDADFVGFKNFQLLFASRDFKRVMKNTAIFSTLNIISLLLPPLFAILLNEVKSTRYRKAAQTITTLPHFISWVTTYAIIYALFTTEGVVNQFLALFGTSQRLLTDKNSVYVFQTAVRVWGDLGWKSIMYIAAIAGIDQALYEAAAVDGAGRFRCALKITIPGIMPTFVVMLLLGVADFVANGTDQYLIFENALVSRNIEVLDLYAYKKGLQLMDYSYATAIGIFKSVVSVVLLLFTNKMAKLIRGESIV